MSTCFVITGMGRSGTSLVASLIYSAGVHMGERLVAPGKANPRGFFEDVDFYRFHEQILLERGYNIFVPPEFQFEPTSKDYDHANRLITTRADRELWGWKDPRTSLFLDFWHHILPDALFLFVYRHPLDVLSSLMRSNILYGEGLLEAIDAWHTYNSKIKAFYQQHPEQCVLCHTSAIVQRVDEFQKLLTSRLGIDLPINRELLDSVYHPEEFQQTYTGSKVMALLQAVHPGSAALYDALQSLADMPFPDQQETRSHELGRLLNILAPDSPALNRSQARGILLLLMDACEPGTLEAYVRGLRAHTRQSEIRTYWLEAQRTNLQSALQQEQRVVHELRDWNEQLERGKGWLETQHASLQDALQQEHLVVQESRVWNQQLEQAKLWLEQQRAAWQAKAEQLEAEMSAAQKSYGQLLEQTKRRKQHRIFHWRQIASIRALRRMLAKQTHDPE